MAKTNETTTQAEEPSWAELLGSNNWDGLLDPLDLSLRRFILRCGDFSQCTYDSFNSDKESDYYASCRYGKRSLLHKVKFEFAADYQVQSLLYATATFDLNLGVWDRETNYIGYIATSTDAASEQLGRREIYIVWRGTQTPFEWIDDAHFEQTSVDPLLGDGGKTDAKVMDGWLKVYTSNNPDSAFMKYSAREQLQKTINQLKEAYSNEKVNIVVTGHSLGAALAVLSAFDLAENGFDNIPVTAVVFACPRVGNPKFMERVEQHAKLKILHIKNKLDPVPLYPLDVPFIMYYSDPGILIEVDGRKSPYLRLVPRDLGDWHNLQGILHVVAGWHGSDQEFELVIKRSPALVNKSSDFLRDEYKIPASWWVVENKGMIRNKEGEWVLQPPPDEDRPVPEFQ